MLGFETLTLAPIDRRLIEPELLTPRGTGLARRLPRARAGRDRAAGRRRDAHGWRRRPRRLPPDEKDSSSRSARSDELTRADQHARRRPWPGTPSSTIITRFRVPSSSTVAMPTETWNSDSRSSWPSGRSFGGRVGEGQHFEASRHRDRCRSSFGTWTRGSFMAAAPSPARCRSRARRGRPAQPPAAGLRDRAGQRGRRRAARWRASGRRAGRACPRVHGRRAAACAGRR